MNFDQKSKLWENFEISVRKKKIFVKKKFWRKFPRKSYVLLRPTFTAYVYSVFLQRTYTAYFYSVLLRRNFSTEIFDGNFQ